MGDSYSNSDMIWCIIWYDSDITYEGPNNFPLWVPVNVENALMRFPHVTDMFQGLWEQIEKLDEQTETTFTIPWGWLQLNMAPWRREIVQKCSLFMAIHRYSQVFIGSCCDNKQVPQLGQVHSWEVSDIFQYKDPVLPVQRIPLWR